MACVVLLEFLAGPASHGSVPFPTSGARGDTGGGTNSAASSMIPAAHGRSRCHLLDESRSGNVWDNAAMESFFSSERTACKLYRTRDDLFDYIQWLRMQNQGPDGVT